MESRDKISSLSLTLKEKNIDFVPAQTGKIWWDKVEKNVSVHGDRIYILRIYIYDSVPDGQGGK